MWFTAPSAYGIYHYDGTAMTRDAGLTINERSGLVHAYVRCRPHTSRTEYDPLPAAHSCLDLGDERFTQGRPHPMIDAGLRAEHMARAARDAAPSYDLLWLADPTLLHLSEAVPARKLLYECVDDHQGFWDDPGLAAEVRAFETQLTRRADLVVATAPALAARLAALNPRTVHVGNGVELARFKRVVTEPAPPRPAGLVGLDGAVVGFYGALGAWIDRELLAAVAHAHPDWTFVLIGPVMAPVDGLSALPNVRLLPPVPYDQLPAYLAHVPVWIAPFVPGPMTMAVDPLKAYEYLAAGRQVVASPLPALAPLDGLLATARGAEAWGAAIARALAAGPRDAAAMEAVWERLAPRDWDALADELDGHIAQVLA